MNLYLVTLTYKYTIAVRIKGPATFTRVKQVEAKDLDDLYQVVYDRFPEAELVGPACIRQIN